MKLYENPLSPNCRKVHALVQHLGLQVETQTVNLQSGAQKEPDFLAINPNGKVPVLVDGKTTIWESNAILSYLASQKDTTLWPKNNERYQIMKWMYWEANHFAPAVSKLVGQYIFAPMRGSQPDQAIIEDALKAFRTHAAVANGQLESTKFLTGETPTIADFSVAVWLGYTDICKLPMAEFKHLSRWWTDVQSLPGGKALLVPKS